MGLISRATIGCGALVLAVAMARAEETVNPDSLESRLLGEGVTALVQAAQSEGDATRGAVLFHQSYLACTKCHSTGDRPSPLGPDLARLGVEVKPEHLIESVLLPSKVMRPEFVPLTVETVDGQSLVGLKLGDEPKGVTLLDPATGKPVLVERTNIERATPGKLSIMPPGLANQLASRQQFLDLARYVIEIVAGGPVRAAQLRPDPALYAAPPLPEYEAHLDHAGMIGGLNQESYQRGEAIYKRVCANCHGTADREGSMPTSLRFASGKFKSGNDPFTMYQTLTRGFGFMLPQAWMVPQQKYDVIHYIREAYLKERNPSQYKSLDAGYLSGLPKGDTRGPEPSKIEPWVVMDYGSSLINTYEIHGGELNYSYKGIAVRLDPGAGGVSRGRQWLIFDHDTLRMAAAWSGAGFIDWSGIHFNGEHQVHPSIVGQIAAVNPIGPGWANPADGSFDDPRLKGRDGRFYGPLPRAWGHYKGLYHCGQERVIVYTVGETRVMELPGMDDAGGTTRTFQIGPRDKEMILQVADWPGKDDYLAPPAAGAPERVRYSANQGADAAVPALLASAAPFPAGGRWQQGSTGQLRLVLPAGASPLNFRLRIAPPAKNDAAPSDAGEEPPRPEELNLDRFTKGGPPQWPQEIKTTATLGEDKGPFAIDVLTPPDDNPWLAQVRLTGFDFTPDGKRAYVCAWDGDVWRVAGLDKPEAGLSWRRIASGLFQPLGLKIVDGKVYATCRDQIVVLHDLNGDEETDYYESFNNDHQVTEHFHEFAMGLQTDAEGNFYYAKSARHALPALVPHHGTLLKVGKDGTKTEIIATGFRAANGVCLNPDGTFIVTDQEGHWNPKNRINWVRPGGFYGNMFGYHDVTDAADSAMEQPLCWITNAFDRSPAELLWVDSPGWGPLRGTLLNLSYGYGQIYVVPHEKIDGQMQGGMCALPIPRFPTGVMRGRFHPVDKQLYACGMYAWAGNQTQPGGFYRVRYTGKPVYLPLGLAARKTGVEIRFSGELDAKEAADVAKYQVRVWALKRTKNYGSEHVNEHPLKVTAAELLADRQTVRLTIPEIAPTWCMAIHYELRGATGESFQGEIHNTIHKLGP